MPEPKMGPRGCYGLGGACKRYAYAYIGGRGYCWPCAEAVEGKEAADAAWREFTAPEGKKCAAYGMVR